MTVVLQPVKSSQNEGFLSHAGSLYSLDKQLRVRAGLSVYLFTQMGHYPEALEIGYNSLQHLLG